MNSARIIGKVIDQAQAENLNKVLEASKTLQNRLRQDSLGAWQRVSVSATTIRDRIKNGQPFGKLHIYKIFQN